MKLDRALQAGRSDFIVSTANDAAVRRLDAWPDWPGGALALVGPAGSGKSHLASIWSEETGARAWDGGSIGRGPLLVEDIDRRPADEAFFHLLNAAPEAGGVLLTARTRPTAWFAVLPDLRSRLNALAVAELDEPDDAVLSGVLARLFAERSIRPPDDLIPYLVRRIQRSVPQARELVARLDDEAAALHRPITRALAREVLDQQGPLGMDDLFD